MKINDCVNIFQKIMLWTKRIMKPESSLHSDLLNKELSGLTSIKVSKLLISSVPTILWECCQRIWGYTLTGKLTLSHIPFCAGGVVGVVQRIYQLLKWSSNSAQWSMFLLKQIYIPSNWFPIAFSFF